MDDLKWDDLSVFLAIVREGSLSGAARVLDVNHSTAWRRLAALEEAVEQPLFHRSQTGYDLTPVGEQVLPHAEAVEGGILAVKRAVAGATDVLSGEVRVTLPESMLPLTTPILARFAQTHPQIQLDLRTGDRFFDLDRREADVAIRPGPQPPDSAVGRRVSAIAWTVYATDTEDCESLPWVCYGDDLAKLAAVQWRRERTKGEPIMRVSTVPAMRSVLVSTEARGMLPCFVGDREPGLKRLQEPISEAEAELWLLVHADLRRSARIRAFVDHAWEGLRDLESVFTGSTTHDVPAPTNN